MVFAGGMKGMPELSKPTSDVNNRQDWLILSIIFWVIFVLLVSIGYLSDPHYTAPLGF